MHTESILFVFILRQGLKKEFYLKNVILFFFLLEYLNT